MKRENLAFLVAGLAFGLLIGLAIDEIRSPPVVASAPGASMPGASSPGAPAGPASPTQMGGAPMMQEMAALRARLEQNPDDLQALTGLAHMFHDIQSWDQAKPYYERAIAIVGNDPDLVTDLGVCFVGTGEFDRALELFERAQAARPGHPQSLFNTAIVAGLYQQDFPRAEAALAQLEQVAPGYERLAQLKADVAAAKSGAPAGS